MKSRSCLPVFLASLLLVSFAGTCPVFAQKDPKTEKSEPQRKKENGTIHLRIEKSENGEKKVYERTYKQNESDGQSFPDGFLFHSGDSLDNFQFYGNNLFDSIKVLSPSGKLFFDSLENDLAGRQFFFNFGMDSLLNDSGNRFYHFDHSLMPDIDSLLRKSFDAGGFFFENLGENFHFRMDTLFNKGLNFNWNSTGFPFGGGNMNLLLDKEGYEIEEIQKDGKTMLRIRPRKPAEEPENLPGSMQPSGAELNLLARSTGLVDLRFQVPADGTTTITVINARGRQVYKEKVKNATGLFAKTINLQKEGSGEFTVKVVHNGKSFTRQVTIP
jgi:hypothetical protein